MSTTADKLKAYYNIKVAVYVCYTPPLALFFAILARMLISANRRNLIPLIIVCVFMILS